MRAIRAQGSGGPEVLEIVDEAKPSPSEGEVLVRVVAAGVNRPDIQQRRGLYPPPPGASDILGLDICGVVEVAAPGVAWPRPGDAVCALVAGGGYADYCAVPAVQCMPVPCGLSFAQAAALPEVLFTCWNSVIWLGRLGEGESILIQGGTSGVGMATIQIAKLLREATVFATASSPEKRAICEELGADATFDYNADWDALLREKVGSGGVDVIVDGQAGPYTEREMSLLAFDGRLVLLASHLGEFAEVNVRQIVRRRLTLTGATIRPRPSSYKGRIARELVSQVWPLLEDGRMRLDVCAQFPFEQVRDAHAVLDANRQIGKVVLLADVDRAEDRPGRSDRLAS
jgi:NADPH2:quinone reductase